MPAFLSDPSQPVQRGAGLASLVPGDLPGQHVFRAAQPQSQQGGLTQTRRVCFLKKKKPGLTFWPLTEALEPMVVSYALAFSAAR